MSGRRHSRSYSRSPPPRRRRSSREGKRSSRTPPPPRSRSRSRSPRRRSRSRSRSRERYRDDDRRRRSRSRDNYRRSPPRRYRSRSRSPPRRDRGYGGGGGGGRYAPAQVPELYSVHEGRVASVQSYGAFVNIPGYKDGLIHISQLSAERVDSVEDVVAQGESVFVKVISLDDGKVSLSLKDVDQGTGRDKNPAAASLEGVFAARARATMQSGGGMPPPPSDAVFGGSRGGGGGGGGRRDRDAPPPELYSIHRAKIASVQTYGAFARIPGYKDGLIHISQLSTTHIEQPTDVVDEGDEVYVKVIAIDDNGKVSLSYKYVNQSTGEDRDPNNTQAEADAQKPFVRNDSRKIDGEAAFGKHAVCTKCGASGHIESMCLSRGGTKYDLITSPPDSPSRGGGARSAPRSAALAQALALAKAAEANTTKKKKRKRSSGSDDDERERSGKRKHKHKHKHRHRSGKSKHKHKHKHRSHRSKRKGKRSDSGSSSASGGGSVSPGTAFLKALAS